MQPAVFAVLFALTGALHAQPAAPEPKLAQLCVNCHGAKGVSAEQHIPSLAGQNEAYLIETLVELKAELVPSDQMKKVTHDLSKAELKGIAAYFARQPYVRLPQPADPARVARGRRVYEQVCSNCHKEEGRATAYAEYPLLAGQSLAYMLKEINHVVARRRGVEAIKRGLLDTLSLERIEDAVHFFASQKVSPEHVTTSINPPVKRVRRQAARGDD